MKQLIAVKPLTITSALFRPTAHWKTIIISSYLIYEGIDVRG